MSLILDGTNGLSDVDGTAAAPAIRGTDTNTGIFFPAADTIAFAEGGAEAMRIDSSGNVGIGTTSPGAPLSFGSTADAAKIFLRGNTNEYAIGTQSNELRIASYSATTFYRLGYAGTESMRINSTGNLLVGTTTQTATPAQGVILSGAGSSSGVFIGHANGTSSGDYYMAFSYNGSAIGSITQNGTTGVLYNLTSDYRLKNNPQALTGAKDFVMALQPKKWQWWDGSGEGVGFIAHEFMEVAKYSGNGIKDAVDADGKPVHQSIQPSSSEVMANLVAFIQEQQALITALTTRITALEAA